VHEARILASIVDDPGRVTERQAERWVREVALMAWRAVHAKDAPDREFIDFLPAIESQSDDPRTYVRKAVSWALRQIGKRNRRLHRAAIRTAERIEERGSRPARWVAADALRELRHPKLRDRLS
jgi:3-methyladenine DNA glycosylase AlkD